jgi:vacuolar-type H+-ATPase subunit H
MSKSNGHETTIKRLLEAESDAKDRISAARDEAEEIVAAARREADRTVETARREAREEATRIVDEANQAGGESTENTPHGIGDVNTLRRRARENMDRAAEYLYRRITGTEE